MHLHNLKTILDTAEVKIDVCNECKARFIYRKDIKGRYDQKQYLEDHKKNFLQPDDKFYSKYYESKDPFEYHKQVEREYQQYQEDLIRRRYNN